MPNKVQPKLYHLTERLKNFPVSETETLGEKVERLGWTVVVDEAFELLYPAFKEYKLEAKRTNAAIGQKGNQNRRIDLDQSPLQPTANAISIYLNHLFTADEE